MDDSDFRRAIDVLVCSGIAQGLTSDAMAFELAMSAAGLAAAARGMSTRDGLALAEKAARCTGLRVGRAARLTPAPRAPARRGGNR